MEKDLKTLACSICGELHRVAEKCTRVTCARCLLAGEPPVVSKDGIDYYRNEKVLEKMRSSLKIEKKIWVGAQEMRDEGLSFREIARRLETSPATILRHTVSKDV